MAVQRNDVQQSYVWLPEGSQSSLPPPKKGKATFLFSCSKSAVVTFKIEGSAPDPRSDSFYIAVDGGDPEKWIYPRTNDWHWKTFSESEYSISGGLHLLHVLGREDGTKLRRVGIVKGKDECCFKPPGTFQTKEIVLCVPAHYLEFMLEIIF